jgi:hypothetical protein
MDEAERALETMLLGRTEWDEEPGLHFMYDDEGIYHIGSSVVPEGMWHPDRTAITLRMFADMLEIIGIEALGPVMPESIVGVVFRCEAWTVVSHVDDADSAELMDQAHKRKLHVHPDRVESRVATAAMIDGTLRMAFLNRNTPTSVQFMGAEDFQEGMVPDELQHILRALGLLKE